MTYDEWNSLLIDYFRLNEKHESSVRLYLADGYILKYITKDERDKIAEDEVITDFIAACTQKVQSLCTDGFDLNRALGELAGPSHRADESIAMIAFLGFIWQYNFEDDPEFEGRRNNNYYRRFAAAVRWAAEEKDLPIDNLPEIQDAYPAVRNIEVLVNHASGCYNICKESIGSDHYVGIPLAHAIFRADHVKEIYRNFWVKGLKVNSDPSFETLKYCLPEDDILNEIPKDQVAPEDDILNEIPKDQVAAARLLLKNWNGIEYVGDKDNITKLLDIFWGLADGTPNLCIRKNHREPLGNRKPLGNREPLGKVEYKTEDEQTNTEDVKKSAICLPIDKLSSHANSLTISGKEVKIPPRPEPVNGYYFWIRKRGKFRPFFGRYLTRKSIIISGSNPPALRIGQNGPTIEPENRGDNIACYDFSGMIWDYNSQKIYMGETELFQIGVDGIIVNRPYSSIRVCGKSNIDVFECTREEKDNGFGITVRMTNEANTTNRSEWKAFVDDNVPITVQNDTIKITPDLIEKIIRIKKGNYVRKILFVFPGDFKEADKQDMPLLLQKGRKRYNIGNNITIESAADEIAWGWENSKNDKDISNGRKNFENLLSLSEWRLRVWKPEGKTCKCSFLDSNRQEVLEIDDPIYDSVSLDHYLCSYLEREQKNLFGEKLSIQLNGEEIGTVKVVPRIPIVFSYQNSYYLYGDRKLLLFDDRPPENTDESSQRQPTLEDAEIKGIPVRKITGLDIPQNPYGLRLAVEGCYETASLLVVKETGNLQKEDLRKWETFFFSHRKCEKCYAAIKEQIDKLDKVLLATIDLSQNCFRMYKPIHCHCSLYAGETKIETWNDDEEKTIDSPIMDLIPLDYIRDHFNEECEFSLKQHEPDKVYSLGMVRLLPRKPMLLSKDGELCFYCNNPDRKLNVYFVSDAPPKDLVPPVIELNVTRRIPFNGILSFIELPTNRKDGYGHRLLLVEKDCYNRTDIIDQLILQEKILSDEDKLAWKKYLTFSRFFRNPDGICFTPDFFENKILSESVKNQLADISLEPEQVRQWIVDYLKNPERNFLLQDTQEKKDDRYLLTVRPHSNESSGSHVFTAEQCAFLKSTWDIINVIMAGKHTRKDFENINFNFRFAKYEDCGLKGKYRYYNNRRNREEDFLFSLDFLNTADYFLQRGRLYSVQMKAPPLPIAFPVVNRCYNFMIYVQNKVQFADFLRTRDLLPENGPNGATCRFPDEIKTRVQKLWETMKKTLKDYIPDRMIQSLLDRQYSDTRKIMIFAAVATRLLSRFSWLERRLPLTWLERPLHLTWSEFNDFQGNLNDLSYYNRLPWKDRIKDFWLPNGRNLVNDDELDQLIQLTCDIHAELWNFSFNEPEKGWLRIFAQDLMLVEFFLIWGRKAILTEN